MTVDSFLRILYGVVCVLLMWRSLNISLMSLASNCQPLIEMHAFRYREMVDNFFHQLCRNSYCLLVSFNPSGRIVAHHQNIYGLLWMPSLDTLQRRMTCMRRVFPGCTVWTIHTVIVCTIWSCTLSDYFASSCLLHSNLYDATSY